LHDVAAFVAKLSDLSGWIESLKGRNVEPLLRSVPHIIRIANEIRPVAGGAGAVPELRARRVRQNVKLGDSIDRNMNHQPAIDSVEIVRAIDQKIVGLRPLAINGIGLAAAQRASGDREAGSDRENAGLKQPELSKIAAVQRQVQNVAFSNGFSQSGDRRLDERSVRLNADLLRGGPDFEPNGHYSLLIYAQ